MDEQIVWFHVCRWWVGGWLSNGDIADTFEQRNMYIHTTHLPFATPTYLACSLPIYLS